MTVTELAKLYAHLTVTRDEDWIWSAMTEKPDLVGGFNRLDSTILKSCGGKVIAKEGADGLLGLSIVHPKFPDGLGVVIKIAHGWDTQATWYVARYVLGVLGFHLRNPYRLDRQKAFIVEQVIPPELRAKMAEIVPFDPWDPNEDRWDFDFEKYAQQSGNSAHPNDGGQNIPRGVHAPHTHCYSGECEGGLGDDLNGTGIFL
jgi:hypothetical protein